MHTPSMTLKNAALLALIGTLLTALLQTYHLVLTALNIARGLIPLMALPAQFIYTFGTFTLFVFFLVYHRAQN